MDLGDRAYLLDLCDAALGEHGLRSHVFPWLLDEAEERPHPVEAWWPGRQLVVLSEEGSTADLTRRSRVLAAYGIQTALLRPHAFERDSAGALRRVPERDEEIIRSELLDARHDVSERSWFDAHIVGVNVDPGEEPHVLTLVGDLDDDWDDDADDDDVYFDALDAAEESPAPSFDAGWRGDAMARAALGAAVLARRTFAVAVAGHGRGDVETQILARLALAHASPNRPTNQGESEPALRIALALDARKVSDALKALARDGLVEQKVELEPDAPPTWEATAAGEEAIAAWIARLLPFFAGWPPDTPGVDDAIR